MLIVQCSSHVLYKTVNTLDFIDHYRRHGASEEFSEPLCVCAEV